VKIFLADPPTEANSPVIWMAYFESGSLSGYAMGFKEGQVEAAWFPTDRVVIICGMVAN
jgi:hypothetical protein